MFTFFSLGAFLLGFIAIFALLPTVVPSTISIFLNSSYWTFVGSYLTYMNLFAPVDVVIDLIYFAFGLFALRLLMKMLFYAAAMLRGNAPPSSNV